MTTSLALDTGCHLSFASTGRYQFASKSEERMMQSAKRKILFLLLVVALVASAARAEVGGKVTGAVKDQTGSVIPGATVVVTNTQTGVKLTATTDQDGVFTFPVLSVGQYQIDVTSDAFKSYRKTDFVIDISSALVADVTLQLKEQDQSIMVTDLARVGDSSFTLA